MSSENVPQFRSSRNHSTTGHIVSRTKIKISNKVYEILQDNLSKMQIKDVLLGSDYIRQYGHVQASQILELVTLKKLTTRGIPVMATKEMGKACFIRQPQVVDGEEYNFVQWKGIGRNPVMDDFMNKEGFELHVINEKESFPLFILKQPGYYMARLYGGAYYEDLITEEENTNKIQKATQGKIRTLKILNTSKFSQEYAKSAHIPMPISEDTGDCHGQKMRDMILLLENEIKAKLVGSGKTSEMAQKIFDQILNSKEASGYSSAILGQNVRASRNIFRVSDLKNGDKELIMTESMKILEKEFKQEYKNGMTKVDYLKKFSFLLGQQAGLFVDTKIVHGALKVHRQDISLAAEICDFDGSYFFDEEYISKHRTDPKKWYNQGKSEQEREWKFNHWKDYTGAKKLYQQIFLIGSHIYPVFLAMGKLVEFDELLDDYIAGFFSNLSQKGRGDLITFLLKDENNPNKDSRDQKIASIDGIATDMGQYGEELKINLEGYQPIFDKILLKLKDKLGTVK